MIPVAFSYARPESLESALALLADWDLDLDEKRPTADLKPWWGRGKRHRFTSAAGR